MNFLNFSKVKCKNVTKLKNDLSETCINLLVKRCVTDITIYLYLPSTDIVIICRHYCHCYQLPMLLKSLLSADVIDIVLTCQPYLHYCLQTLLTLLLSADMPKIAIICRHYWHHCHLLMLLISLLSADIQDYSRLQTSQYICFCDQTVDTLSI